jgi:heme/copper-type cytochrome/quinol oxidase subunit 4
MIEKYSYGIIAALFLTAAALLTASYARFNTFKWTNWEIFFLMLLVALFTFLGLYFMKLFFKE